MRFSVLITSYECYGKGEQLLQENLITVFSQTYRPLQCIVSDHSRDNKIENMIKTLNTNGVDFIYVRYSENYGSPCHNWNNALKYSTGDYIHYMAMDERYASETSVQGVVDFMKISSAKWIACYQLVDPMNTTYIPRWNNNILQVNTIGGPATIVIDKSLKDITLDPQFIWYLDTDWYFRLYQAAGHPVIYNSIFFIGRIHEFQLTNTVCSNPDLVKCENERMVTKYGSPLPNS